jgi:hypothetical protein
MREIFWPAVAVVAVILWLSRGTFGGRMDGKIQKYGFYVILLSAVLDLIERARRFWAGKKEIGNGPS